MFMTGYECIACGLAQPADYGGWVCPSCGKNLDVRYDYEAVARRREGFPAQAADLFSYLALLPLEQPRPAFPLKVGGTPLHHAVRLGESIGLGNLYLKDETLNPSASLKDRASAVAIACALDAGAEVVAVASTGNAGSSLACMAAVTGVSAVVFVPAAAPPAKLTQIMAFGARVLAVEGNYDDAYDLCLQASGEFGWFNRSTGYNAFTREGKKTCSFEIWQDLGREVPDRVLVPTGDGNIISAVWKGWRELHALGLIGRLPKIDCVQSSSSPAISRAISRVRTGGGADVDWATLAIQPVAATTVADSIAVDRPRDGLAAVKAVIESGGEAVAVSDEDILAAIPEMARLSGVFPEPAAAAPWAALKQLVRGGRVKADERVVCLVTGSGLKDIAGAATAVGRSRPIEASLDAVRACLA